MDHRQQTGATPPTALRSRHVVGEKMTIRQAGQPGTDRSVIAAAEIVGQETAAVLVLVAVDAEVLPVAAVGRIVVMIAVAVMDGQQVQRVRLELAGALRADPSMQGERAFAIALARARPPARARRAPACRASTAGRGRRAFDGRNERVIAVSDATTLRVAVQRPVSGAPAPRARSSGAGCRSASHRSWPAPRRRRAAPARCAGTRARGSHCGASVSTGSGSGRPRQHHTVSCDSTIWRSKPMPSRPMSDARRRRSGCSSSSPKRSKPR